jgi:large exoprotein involved in heme utilization and adhesion
MNSKVISNKTKLAIAISKATIAAVCLGVSLFAAAEVTFDDGTGDTLTGSMVIDAGRGLTQGANLLHTFSTFNVLAGETANFTGPDVIDNIIARVTGAGGATNRWHLAIVNYFRRPVYPESQRSHDRGGC